MTAQRFVEFVQIHWRKYGFFPHPAVLRALFGWDFGTRGLSILHFTRVSESEKRTRVRGNDMNFSAIVGAVEVLCAIAQQFYKPVVYETLMAALRFLGELRVSDLPSSPEALSEVVSWLDDRLELFRLLITEENWPELDQVKSHFNSAHESFVRVHQIILRQDIIAAVKVVNGNTSRQGNQTKTGSERRVIIPPEVRQALPKQGKKPICVRFLSAQGCRGKNGNCVIKNLCHFKPATVPDIVREFIDKNYGGLSEDLL
eukprot:jgi/Phyca11/131916/e_gw1.121.35.1